MTAVLWVFVGVVVWVVGAVVVSVLVGGATRVRDRQVPRDDAPGDQW